MSLWALCILTVSPLMLKVLTQGKMWPAALQLISHTDVKANTNVPSIQRKCIPIAHDFVCIVIFYVLSSDFSPCWEGEIL